MPVLNVYENIVLPVELDGDVPDKKFMKDVVSLLALKDKLKAKYTFRWAATACSYCPCFNCKTSDHPYFCFVY